MTKKEEIRGAGWKNIQKALLIILVQFGLGKDK